MPRIKYVEKAFSESKQALIGAANRIIAQYAAQGFDLTLRQLYYQFVARNLIRNTEQSYKSLGDLIADARLAGLIDWDAIVDRTRALRGNQHWEKPSDVVRSAASSFLLDKWKDQPNYVEVWVEKDALRSIVGQVAGRWDCNYFSCRGYVSISEMWAAAQRLRARAKNGKRIVILHLGDHDPSGIDMSRDIEDRLRVFKCDVTLERIALNMDQVRRYGFPPNPAKVTDSRYASYQAEYGDSSWELDAIEPVLLSQIIEAGIRRYADVSAFEAARAREAIARRGLEKVAERYVDILEFLRSEKKG